MKTTVIPFKILSIDGGGYHLLVKLHINGKPANLIIDTGASKTVFDKSLIIKYLKQEKFELHDQLTIGIGTNQVESHTASIKRIRVGDVEILDYKALLLDLSSINQSYHNVELGQIEGVLGSDILLKYKAIIDYEKKELILKYSNGRTLAL